MNKCIAVYLNHEKLAKIFCSISEILLYLPKKCKKTSL